MYLLLAALPGVITSCLLGYVLYAVLARQAEERQAHRIEVDALTHAHADQLASLTEAHRREVANLCQRIQAPQIAVAEHVGQTTHDPAQVDLENDAVLAQIAKREEELRMLELHVTERAEELAAER